MMSRNPPNPKFRLCTPEYSHTAVDFLLIRVAAYLPPGENE